MLIDINTSYSKFNVSACMLTHKSEYIFEWSIIVYINIYNTFMVNTPVTYWGCHVVLHGMAIPSDAFTQKKNSFLFTLYLVINLKKKSLDREWPISVLYQFITISIKRRMLQLKSLSCKTTNEMTLILKLSEINTPWAVLKVAGMLLNIDKLQFQTQFVLMRQKTHSCN